MQLHPLYINTKPPKAAKNSWIKQGLNQQNCCFIGYLSNAQAIREQLLSNINPPDDQQSFEQLIELAVKRWGHSVNQYLQGDYVIAWLNENEQFLCITASARSSFSLFYTLQNQADDDISIATDIKKLHQSSNKLNPTHWLQMLSLGPLVGRHTYLNNIRHLQPGETIIWDMNDYKCTHQFKLEGEQQLKFADKGLAERFENTPVISYKAIQDDADKPLAAMQLFNRLPQVAHRLGEPINDGLLAQFDLQISQCEATVVTLDESWFTSRVNINQPPFNKQRFDSKITWQKGIIRDNLLKYRHNINHRQDYLYTAFEMDNHDQLNFDQWLDLHYIIPAWCQLYQRIANGYGKTIVNPFIRADQALTLMNNTREHIQSQSLFAITDNSMCNIYDSAQRLFRSGEPTSKQWFQLTPTATAKFIKQSQQFPRLVEQTCIAMLTFDYLSKFHHSQIGPD